MTEFKDEKLIRDALGSPIPQYFNVDSQAFAAKTENGSVSEVDFSKTKLLRDKLGSPIPQLWDVTSGKWVRDTGLGGGKVEPIVGDTAYMENGMAVGNEFLFRFEIAYDEILSVNSLILGSPTTDNVTLHTDLQQTGGKYTGVIVKTTSEGSLQVSMQAVGVIKEVIK